MLALTLQAVVSQRLVRRADGKGRVAAMEILINSPKIRDLILEGKTSPIEKAMAESGDFYRMQTFNQALARFVQDRTISEEEAAGASTSPSDLRLILRGVQSGSSSSALKAVPAPPRPSPPPPKGSPGGPPGSGSTGAIEGPPELLQIWQERPTNMCLQGPKAGPRARGM